MFRKVAADVDFPELEQRIIGFWRERDIFRKSLEKPAPRGRYTFYEGPPTANGKPGVHHVISRAFKDLFPRFKTMQGFHVGRKGGWDTHGLPVEIAIEKRLGFTSKAQIEEYGIEKFNNLCRSWVFENIQDWNEMTERIGFWLDLDNAYITYQNSYIESCWWVMKELWKRGLLVEDYKTTWHSPSSNTTLASHEVSLGYRDDVEDPSVFPKFPADKEALVAAGIVVEQEKRPVFFLAWTTTPWTLAANSGLAVRGDANYLLIAGPPAFGGQGSAHLYVLAEDRREEVFGSTPHQLIGSFPGSRLEGLPYQALLRGRPAAAQEEARGWRVVTDDFVSLEEGTGIVHLAPAYGDLDVGRKHRLPTVFSVDLSGRVLPEVKPLDAGPEEGPYSGRWFKDADKDISRDLLARQLLFRETTVLHSYPFNWRDGTPLLNCAKKSWYIRTTALKERLLENNDDINWHPDHIRTGRFGKWLENNVDWALSRERYWGAPLPIWESDDGERICVGSIRELEELTGENLADLELHRPYVDRITFEKGGKSFRRVPYTVDVWFESGAMPYAQWHYMGEASSERQQRDFIANFPADYICEAVDQTRGWFYSLHALATLLSDSGNGERQPGPLAKLKPNTSAFRNVIVLGHIVDENGEKMSKSKGNVVDPWTVLNTQGADALRWYLYSSSPPESSKRFSRGLVEETLRDFFLTLWHTYSFFVLYANLDRPELNREIPVKERPDMDRWLMSTLQQLVLEVTERLEDYDPTAASRAIRDFVVDDLSNWYVRRNRRRFWKSANDDDKLAAYLSLHQALITTAKLMAPMAPFLSEEIYQNLVRRLEPQAAESVHLSSWPPVDHDLIDRELMRDMAVLIRIVELGRSARAASAIRTRQPLPEVLVRVRSEDELRGLKRFEEQLCEELNVKSVNYLEVTADFVDYQVRPNLPLLGRRLGRLIPELKRKLEKMDGRIIAANVREGKPTLLELGGEQVSLEPEAFLLHAQSPVGYSAVEEEGYLAALNTTLTPELLREGLVREVIRQVQNARKNAHLDVADTIILSLEGSPELRRALLEHLDTLKSEVLATEVAFEELVDAEYREQVEVADSRLVIGLKRERPRAG